MNIKNTYIIFSLVILLSGCTQKAQNISPIHVSPDLYVTNKCEELKRQINIEKRKLSFFEVLQRDLYEEDVALVLFLGVSKSMFTNEDETNTNVLAQQKGKIIAMEQALKLSHCNYMYSNEKDDHIIVKTSPGMVLISQHIGKIKTIRHWVGIAVAKGGYRVDDYYSPDYKIKEIIYQGISNNKVKFYYQEFKRDLEDNYYSESLSFDLNNSNKINIQGIKFKIIEVTNNHIIVEKL